jgi:hypothetical protein
MEDHAHSGLKYSKGSRQARQRYMDLQAVEPKAERRSVCCCAARAGDGSACGRKMRMGALGSRLRGDDGVGRRDAVLAQLALAVFRDPVGGPGRRAAQRGARGAQALASIAREHVCSITSVAGQPE